MFFNTNVLANCFDYRYIYTQYYAVGLGYGVNECMCVCAYGIEREIEILLHRSKVLKENYWLNLGGKPNFGWAEVLSNSADQLSYLPGHPNTDLGLDSA